jgi:hypothetical protein
MNKKKFYKEDILAAAVLILSVVFLVIGFIKSNMEESDILLFSLFIIPIVAQGIGWGLLYRVYYTEIDKKKTETDKKLINKIQKTIDDINIFREFYFNIMSICLLSYCSLLWIYGYELTGLTFKMLSYFAFVCIIILTTWGAGRMTYFIISSSKEPATASVHKGLVQTPFGTFVFSFSLFLCIIFLFGFAFAFHDKSTFEEKKYHALYMPGNYSSGSETKAPDNPNNPSIDFTESFKFEEGKAILELKKVEISEATPSTLIKKQVLDANHEFLNKVIKKIKELTKDDKRVIITLIGRADSKPVGENGPYPSNYQLSLARIQNVKYEILTKLYAEKDKKWRNIEWFDLPLSNEPIPQSSSPKNIDKSFEQKIVKVSLEQISEHVTTKQMHSIQANHLTLLDYMYFSIYTISTSAYGDIVPTTQYAKFLCSLSNIIEVFFFVVFFNVLLSSKKT